MPTINPSNLRTIANYAKIHKRKRNRKGFPDVGVSVTLIQGLINDEKLPVVDIDGVQFIDVSKIK